MEHQMMNLFAVPVYKASLGRGFTAAEQACFQEQMRDPALAISNHSSRNKNVLASQAMLPLRALIQEHLDSYFKLVYSTANEVSLAITQSWLSRTRKGESHHAHSHPNSVVSGVVYIRLADQDGINFYRNDDQNWYELIPAEQNYYNAHNVFMPVEEGSIILFPSHIKHGVREVSSEVERLSLAFNTFFTGTLGRGDHANSLTIKVG